ncbi:MAG: hypothetical protein IKW99_09680 [Bacteroidales bacterium]|nr:hypothetical protein [Bacteroidales bacterium]
MRIIDDKSFDSLLERIDALKYELSLLEEQVKALRVEESVTEPVEPVIPDDLPEEPEPEVVEPEIVEPEIVEPEIVEPEVEAAGEAAEVIEPVVPEEEPIDIAPVDDTPIDISISDSEDMPVDVGQPSVRHRSPAGQSILDTAKADTAVMDVMAEKQAWRTDRPGMPVKNIISAISLNDRVLLINVLFGEDPMLFQETIAKFNAMGSLSEALAYIAENHPDWDMNSEPVYRLMMAVRRKLS